MNKQEELDQVKAEMEADNSLPLKKGASKLVFGRGNPCATILMIGEAPGYYEDQQGLPFVGNAGKLLDATLRENKLDPETDVFITNVVHHRPPGNRDPLPTELATYRPYLDKIIRIIDSPVIVTLGRYSMGMFLPEAKISRVHGQVFKVDNKTIVPMFHPAAALRSEAVMVQFREDFKKFVNNMNNQGLPEINEPKKLDSQQMDFFNE